MGDIVFGFLLLIAGGGEESRVVLGRKCFVFKKWGC